MGQRKGGVTDHPRPGDATKAQPVIGLVSQRIVAKAGHAREAAAAMGAASGQTGTGRLSLITSARSWRVAAIRCCQSADPTTYRLAAWRTKVVRCTVRRRGKKWLK